MSEKLTEEDLSDVNGRLWYTYANNNDGKGYGFSDFNRVMEEDGRSNLHFDFTCNGRQFHGGFINGMLMMHEDKELCLNI